MITQPDLPKFLAVDFYCGAGGTTRGLIDAGGYAIAGVDKDPACGETYRRNNRNRTLDEAEPEFIQKDMFPRSIEYPDGQQDEILDELRKLIASKRADAEAHAGTKLPLLFAVCAPCQSFTKFVQRHITVARSKGRARDRNLLAQAVVFIEEFRPDMVLSENVAGIERGRYGQIWSEFKDKLTELGYRIGSDEVNACHFDVPQRRRRSVIVAVKAYTPSRAYQNITVPRGDPDKTLTVASAIGRLPFLSAGGKDSIDSNHRCRKLTAINQSRLRAVDPGEPNFGFPDELKLPCHRRLDAKGKRGFGDVYTRLRPDRPAPTITTRFHSVSNGRFGHYDKEQARGLSLREGAMLRSFPIDYEFYADGMDAVARMIGNAVPPKLAERLAQYLYDVWQEEQTLRAVSSQGSPR